MALLLSLPSGRRNDAVMDEARTAIVTGAGKRVGREIALALLNDGWRVVAHVRHDRDDVPDGGSKPVPISARRTSAAGWSPPRTGLRPRRFVATMPPPSAGPGA